MFLCDRLLHRVGSDKAPGNRHFAPQGPDESSLVPPARHAPCPAVARGAGLGR